MAVYIGHDKCSAIYVAKNGQQVRVSSVWVGDKQVFPDVFILRVGVSSGSAYAPLREWAASIGKTHQTITEITVPMEVIGPSLQGLFEYCSSLTSIPELDTSQVATMRSMFRLCSSLTNVPELDTSSVTNMRYMFDGCESLTTIPELDTSQVTDMRSMFNGCSSLTTIPELDTSQVTDMRSMFNGCSSLTAIPELDTSSVTNMQSMFNGCNALTSVPALDTGQVTDMTNMFYGCSSLTTIPELDTSSVTNMTNMFYGCSSLESVTLPGMGSAFTTKWTLAMATTKLNAAAANALMQSLGTPPPGGNLRLPATAQGCDTSIATAKNWTVTIA